MTGQVKPATEPAVATADAVIAAEALSRKFGDQLVLDNVTFSVPAGTVLGVIGPSGAGKTTCLRLMTGALKPTSGAVRVLGQDPVRLTPSARRRIGYMPQLLSLQPDLTASENIDLA